MSGHVLLIGSDAADVSTYADRLQEALFRVTIAPLPRPNIEDQYDCLVLTPSADCGIDLVNTANIPALAIECGAHTPRFSLGHIIEDRMHVSAHKRELVARIRAMIRRHHAARELKLREGTNRALGFNEANDAFSHQKTCYVVTRAQTLPPVLQQISNAGAPFAFDLQTPEDFQTTLARKKIDAVVIDDTDLGERTANTLLDLRAHPNTRYAAILCVYGQMHRHNAFESLELGADDVIVNNDTDSDVLHRLTLHWRAKDTNDALRRSNQIGLYAAVTDTLTGLFNRRYAMTHLHHLCDIAKSKNGSVTALMIDIDHFKQVNDTFGHFAGDSVLMAVAETLKSTVRASDLVARIGGEEFVILLPDIKERDAKRLADRLCKSVRKMKLDAITGSITISIGVSRYDPTSLISYANSDILEQADTALYTAKRNGRDQVSYYSQF